MKKLTALIKKNYGEIVFQLIVAVVLFFFYSYNLDNSFTLFPYKILFFLNYAFAALLINYVLLPKMYSQKKFLLFFGSVLLLIFIVILIDELVLEQIYFPDTRGKYFPGIWFTLIETLPIIIFFVGFKFAWDFNKKQGEIEKLKTLVQESELQFLKSQINPHFLFNNLNNLYAHAMEYSTKTPSIILELSSVLRYMLYDCKEQFVPLEKEIVHLKNYTALNELQIEHRGEIGFETGKIPSGYTIAPLILTVFIENAFKHSTASQSEDISIEIIINTTQEGFLTFICKNSFLPVTNTEKLSKGIGLINVKKRLSLLYPDAHELETLKGNNFFKVTLTIQLNVVDLC
ncbi:MAG: sensor histidine kinase [Flavobacteriaceae bacterium]